MDKSPDAFRTISEVADWLGIPAHVLRFWESKFTHVKPVKRAGGRRYYRPADMQLLGGIKKLLHDDGLTIKGVQKILREQGVGHVSSLSQSLDEPAASGPIAGDGTVLSFKAKRQPKPDPTKPDTPEPEQIELQAQPVPAPPESAPPKTPPAPLAEANKPATPADEPPASAAPETPGGPSPEQAPLAVQQTASDTAKEPTETQAEPADTTAAKPADAPPEESPAQQPILPSFLHRPAARPAPVAVDPAPEPVPEPATKMRAMVVDAPDPPDANDLPYTPGLLGRLAGLQSLTVEQARQIAPLAKQLRTQLTRTDAL